jgi:hypothetical protein
MGFFFLKFMAHKKDAYYFSHDSSASRDIKMLKIKYIYGWEGIGLFWGIIETLRETTDFKFESNKDSIDLLASILQVDAIKLQNFINDAIKVGLFVESDGYFYSNSLNDRMDEMNKKRLNGIVNGKKGGRPTKEEPKNNLNHNLNHNLNESKTKPLKESKVKESKVNIIVDSVSEFIAPTKDEVIEYFVKSGYKRDIAIQAYFYYDSLNWNNKLGKAVINWKNTMVTNWFKPENKVTIVNLQQPTF